MSWTACETPEGQGAVEQPTIETVIVPRTRDLGGFEVQRILPSVRRRMVGPFIFFDRMGPVSFAAGRGLDVRPHPHIGLATVTYLFEGEIVHRDSLGSHQPITAGAVNWMTAGRGIAHSERTGAEVRRAGGRLFGLQAWVALPRTAEEVMPQFSHHGLESLPQLAGAGWQGRLIAGSFEGITAPTPVASPTLYADITLRAGARFALSAEHEERALYVVAGDVSLRGYPLTPGVLFALVAGQSLTVDASSEARLIVIGGASMDGPRFIWWNFVSSSRERIEQAKADWKGQRFPSVPGEHEFIPLPEES